MNGIINIAGGKRLLRLKGAVLTVLLAVFIIGFFFPAPVLNAALQYVTLAAVLASLPYTGLGSGVMCLLLFMAGGYLLAASGAGWPTIVEALGKNSGFLALLIAVPLLGVPLKSGGYIEVLDSLAEKYMRRRWQMYWVPALLSHVLGVFMNLGAVPLTHEITARGRMSNHPGLLARSLSRGFGAALLWSPNMIVTALVLGYMEVPWQSYAHLGLAFAALALLTGFVADLPGWGNGNRYDYDDAGAGEGRRIDRVKLTQLMVAGIVFLAAVMLVETKTGRPVISVVPVLALIFPALWMVLLGRWNYVAEGYADYFKNRLNGYGSEVVLFVAAGFFSGALSHSGWSVKLCSYVMHFSSGSKSSAALVILASIVAAGLAGIHPMVLVSALAASLDPAALGFTPVQLSLVLISGWALGATVSPMSGTSLVVGSLTGKGPLAVGFANYLHCALVLAAVVVYIRLA